MATRDVAEPQEFVIPEEEASAIIHNHIDRHYRRVLDEPVPAPGSQTPRRGQNGEWTGQGRLAASYYIPAAFAGYLLAQFKEASNWTTAGVLQTSGFALVAMILI